MDLMQRAAGKISIAADFAPRDNLDPTSVLWEARKLGKEMEGTEAILKVNSILRYIGYELISEFHARGLGVFADLKLDDISATLGIDGLLLKRFKPEMLTVMCAAGVDSLKALKDQLPDTKVLGVTFLTTLAPADALAIHGTADVPDIVLKLADLAQSAGLDGVICSPKEVGLLSSTFGTRLEYWTPGVRMLGKKVEGDDQNPDRTGTITESRANGATGVVIGRPITQAKNRRAAFEEARAEMVLTMT
jgi:orotidine-5'-phosphate decarboxylase